MKNGGLAWSLLLLLALAGCGGGSAEGRTVAPDLDPASLVEIRSLEGCTNHVYGLEIDPTGSFVAAGDCDGRLLVWDFESGKIAWSAESPLGTEGCKGCLFDLRMHLERGKGWILTEDMENAVRIWSLFSSTEPRILFRNPRRGVRFLLLSADGRSVVSHEEIERVNRITVWDVESGKKERDLSSPIADISTAAMSENGVIAVARLLSWFGPPNEGEPDLAVLDRDGKTLGSLREGRKHQIKAIALDERRRLCAFGSREYLGVWAWERPEPSWVVETGDDLVNDIQFSPDGRFLVTAHRDHGGEDGTIRFWSLKDGALARRISAHFAVVDRIRFTPDGRFLLSAGGNRDVKIWGAEPASKESGN